jgi:ATP-dependent helicase HepA
VTLELGNTVTFPSAPGIGRIAELDGMRVRVDFFESAAEVVAESVWRDVAEVRRVPLGEQTRVFFKDGQRRWRSGRVVGGGPDIYFVRVPNLPFDVDIAESRLRVRWEKPPQDPLQVLLMGANDTPRFRDAREPVRRLLLAERAATASATGIASAGVLIHAHQLSAALRIIRDPVQRYLLADEVGLGKTIQAGLVMRQLLIDKPGRSIGIIVPAALVAQWRSELLDKFYLDDFRAADGELPFRILSHGEPHRWSELNGVDLLVVDEAHLLARTTRPDEPRYKELTAVAHAVPRVLMLSATPFSSSPTRHLALLHLLDPQLFRWEDEGAFGHLLAARHQLALAVFGLDEEPDPDNPELLELQFAQIRQLLPDDGGLHLAMERARDVMSASDGDPDAADRESLRRAVAAVRAHVSETYRLHHRVIRNRRHVIERQRLDEGGLLAPFEFTGRTRVRVARLESEEASAGANAIADWAARCSAAILDNDLDAAPYGRALGILISRLGGPVQELLSTLDYRVTGAESSTLLSDEKVLLAAAPTLDFEANVRDDLATSAGTDGLDSVAAAISKRCDPTQQVVVFCGRGSLAAGLADALTQRSEVRYVYAHIADQTETHREAATANWRERGGILVVDDSGDVGRNFQEADVAFHVRLPWNPNALEQRIGRVDRYGNHVAAQQFVIADADRDGLLTAWIKVLASGFRIFTESISTLQETVDDLADDVWTTAVTDGIEGILDWEVMITEVLRRERRRINELDALEASFGSYGDGETMALAIASYEEDAAGIEESLTRLIRGEEGFRFVGRPNIDGSVTFERGMEDRPLLSPRLLGRLETAKEARTGFFDRWKLKPGRRLFRRGNPFIDGLEVLLGLDDRGQAVAMWRFSRSGPNDPMTFFGFDFVVEADITPMLEMLAGRTEVEPIARRRADAALAPQHQRVWIPSHAQIPVDDAELAAYLSLPYLKGRDVNLNFERIGALHTLLGGEANLAPVAENCLAAAREYVAVVADVDAASRKAIEHVRWETEILLAQSRARSQAAGLVLDPAALDVEVEMGRAIEAGVAAPVIRVGGVSCVVVSAQSWADYV